MRWCEALQYQRMQTVGTPDLFQKCDQEIRSSLISFHSFSRPSKMLLMSFRLASVAQHRQWLKGKWTLDRKTRVQFQLLSGQKFTDVPKKVPFCTCVHLSLTCVTRIVLYYTAVYCIGKQIHVADKRFWLKIHQIPTESYFCWRFGL